MNRPLLILISLFAVVSTLWSDSSVMQDDGKKVDPIKMAGVKSAYIYNFTKFVRWPECKFETEETAFRVGIIGKDPFGDIIDKAFEGKTVPGKDKTSPARRIEIKRLDIAGPDKARSDNIDQILTLPINKEDLKSYHIIFVSESVKEHFKAISEAATEVNALTVGDDINFTEQKGMIELVFEDRRILLDINFERIKKTKLSISSKLLKVGNIVRENPDEDDDIKRVKG